MAFNNIDHIVVFITSSSSDEAKMISSALIDEKLAACTNIIPEVNSIFSWQGKVCNEHEVLIIAKTRLSIFDKLQARIKELHSYDVPEIIALPIIAGSADYLKWINNETTSD